MTLLYYVAIVIFTYFHLFASLYLEIFPPFPLLSSVFSFFIPKSHSFPFTFSFILFSFPNLFKILKQALIHARLLDIQTKQYKGEIVTESDSYPAPGSLKESQAYPLNPAGPVHGSELVRESLSISESAEGMQQNFFLYTYFYFKFFF